MNGRPEPMLLENGDLLVPDERGTEMVRLTPGDAGHAEWLAHLQHQRRGPEPRDRGERATPPTGGKAGRTVAGCGLGFLVAIAVVAVLLVVAVLVVLSLVSDVNVPEIPGLPEDLPEDVPGGFVGHIARI